MQLVVPRKRWDFWAERVPCSTGEIGNNLKLVLTWHSCSGILDVRFLFKFTPVLNFNVVAFCSLPRVPTSANLDLLQFGFFGWLKTPRTTFEYMKNWLTFTTQLCENIRQHLTGITPDGIGIYITFIDIFHQVAPSLVLPKSWPSCWMAFQHLCSRCSQGSSHQWSIASGSGHSASPDS